MRVNLTDLCAVPLDILRRLLEGRAAELPDDELDEALLMLDGMLAEAQNEKQRRASRPG